MLKGIWSITYSKWHHSKGKVSIGTCKSYILLIFTGNRNLVVTRITIKEAIEFLTSQPIHRLVNERKRKMILMCSLVHLPIVHAYPSTNDSSCRNYLILLIFNDFHATLLQDTFDRTHPDTIINGINNSSI